MSRSSRCLRRVRGWSAGVRSSMRVGTRFGPADRGGGAGRVWQDDVARGAREAEVGPSGLGVRRRSRQRPGRPLHLPRSRARRGGARRAEGVPMIAAQGVGVADVVRLVSAIARMSEPVIVVLDNAELLNNAECHDMIAELSLRLPPGSQLASARVGRCLSPSRAFARSEASSRSAETISRWMPRNAGTARRCRCSAVGCRCRAARRPNRGLAHWALPGSAGDERRQPPPRGGLDLQRDRPLRCGVPALGVPGPCLEVRRAVPHAHLHPRPDMRSAV